MSTNIKVFDYRRDRGDKVSLAKRLNIAYHTHIVPGEKRTLQQVVFDLMKRKNRKSVRLQGRRDGVLIRPLQQALSRYPANRGFNHLSPRAKLVLRLIYEDLKGHRFFSAMRNIGLDDTFHQPELGSLILTYTGLTHKIKDSYSFYYNLLCRHSKGLNANAPSIAKKAVRVYLDLIAKKH